MIKKVLIFATGLATILVRKVAGLVVESFKRFWNNWQWLLALIALLYAIFLFYYNSTTTTPARITECEKHLAEHISKSDKHFEQIDRNISELNVLNAGINAKLDIIIEDTNTTKKLMFELLGHRL